MYLNFQKSEILKIIFYAFFITTTLVSTFLLNNHIASIKHNRAYEKSEILNETQRNISLISKELERIVELVVPIEKLIEKSPINLSDIKTIIAKNLNANSSIEAMGIIVDKEANNGIEYTTYSYKEKDKIQTKSIEPVYEKDDWFEQAIQKKFFWSDPYFNNDFNAYAIRYSKKLEVNSKNFGVAFIDISLDTIKNFVRYLEVGKSGYATIISKSGKFVTNPVEKHVFTQRTALDIAKKYSNEKFKKALENSELGKSGLVEFFDTLIEEEVLSSYYPIPNTNWSLFSNYVRDEVFAKYREGYNKSFLITLLMIVIALIFATFCFTKSYLGEGRRLARSSLLISIIFCVGIGATWYNAYQIQLIPENTNQTFFIDPLRAKKILEFGETDNLNEVIDAVKNGNFKITHDIHAKYIKLKKIIPIGILVRSIEFLNSSVIQINGFMWGRFPKNLDSDLLKGFFFSDSVYNKDYSIVYQEETENEKIICWNFISNLTENFDYSKFPIDHKHIVMRILPREIDDIALVPSVIDYPLLNPLALPGLISDITVTGWDIESSFFSYEKRNYTTSLGLAALKESAKQYELCFNVMIKRKILDPFISILLPLLVALFMLFLALLLAGKESHTATLATVSGLFFAVILAHINLRSKLANQPIFYFEYFYIISYLMMILVVLMETLLALDIKPHIFSFENNLLAKVLFWPILLGSYFVLSIVTFY